MRAAARGAVPVAADITPTYFSQWMPFLMVAAWDADITESRLVFVGSEIDRMFREDVAGAKMAYFFRDPAHRSLHLSVARRVIRERKGAFLTAVYGTDDRKIIDIQHLRLPLIAEGGGPGIVSLLSLKANGLLADIDKVDAGVEIESSIFLDVMPDEDVRVAH